MRIVATSDSHFFVDPSIIPDGDVFIHAGDLMDRGTVDEWDDLLAWLEVLPHKHKYFVPGNHDFHLMLYPGPAMQDLKWASVTTIGHPLSSKTTVLPNGMKMGGSPWVTNLARWAFNSQEMPIAEYIFGMGPVDVMVTHSPAYGHLDEVMTKQGIVNTGIQAYNTYMDSFNPKIWINGHIHEGYGHKKVNETDVYNVCLCDIEYKHRNAPIVIDI